MSRRHATLACCVAAATAAGSGCGGHRTEGPPELRLGRDECAECGMLISEERCSSAFLIDRNGRREHLTFDDIGCMLDHERDRGEELRIVGTFVHDHSTKAWVTSTSCVFLLTDGDRPPTPMGSGILAFAGPEGAEHAQREFGGRVLDYAGIVAARREGAGAQDRGPRGGP